MTDRELMQQARNALMYLWDGCPTDKALVERLDDRLAQPEPEPVAWMHDSHVGFNVPLYTAPPQREWQGLTDEEIKDHWINVMRKIEGTALPIPEFARAIEAKLKAKNHD